MGFRMDARSELQELTEADYDRNLDAEDDRPLLNLNTGTHTGPIGNIYIYIYIYIGN